MRRVLAVCLSLILFLMTSCASIVSKSTYGVNISSDPTGAKFTVKDEYNRIIAKGTTPTVVILDADDGYFCRAKYYVSMELDGYESVRQPLKGKLDPWYIGNILWGIVGGAVGFLIVDPATGAMWKLPKGVFCNLEPMVPVEKNSGAVLTN